MLATRRGLARPKLVRALSNTRACLRANFLSEYNTHRIRWRGLVEIFFTPSWYTARIRMSFKFNLNIESIVKIFITRTVRLLFWDLFLSLSLSLHDSFFFIAFSFFWKNFLHSSATLNLFTLHYTVPHESSNRFPPSCSSLPPRGPCKVTYY